MAGYDFNDTKEQQQEYTPGPVPEGSKVLLKLTINQPKNQASSTNYVVNKSQTGLYNILCTYTVIAGTYEGYRWYDMIMLPPEKQRANMTEGQRKACEISAQKIRGMIEASRNVNPKDKSPNVKQKRAIQAWDELDGMIFPARVTINPNGREYKGKTYYNNRISYVVTPDNKEYAMLMSGGEIINEGGLIAPVRTAPKPQQYDDFAPTSEASAGDVAGMTLDDVPF